jgi:protein-S-isoprenylcysteine O-methyltransferase Ste14
MDTVERWVRRIGAVLGLVTLAIALFQGVWRGLQRPGGRTTGMGDKVLRAPIQLVFGLLWIGLCIFLWRPLPIRLSRPARIVALILGLLLYFPGLALYLWGARTLGQMHRAASGLGVQLNVSHSLITHGPFAIVRHPLYLGLQIAALGGLLVYRTWTLAFVTINFLGLFIRARREEQALAAEFGAHWDEYRQRVPAWIPWFRAEIDRQRHNPGFRVAGCR